MARLPYLRYDDAPEGVRAALEIYPPQVRCKNVWGVLSHAEGVLVPLVEYGRALATRTALPAVLRECAVLRVAWLTRGAEYIWTEHVPIARSLGLGEGQIAALSTEQPDPAALGPDPALIVRFTDQYFHDANVDEDTWAALTSRLSPREIVELVMATGHFMMFARLHAIVGTDLDEVDGVATSKSLDPGFFGGAEASG